MSTLLCFDCFEVDPAAGRLFKRGARIDLREQSFQVLALLLEHPGTVVSREDLRRRLLWPTEVFVDFENNLNTTAARLREVLGDSADGPRFIETLPRRGYRFIASVSEPVAIPGARQITRDPESALAYDALAQLYWFRAISGSASCWPSSSHASCSRPTRKGPPPSPRWSIHRSSATSVVSLPGLQLSAAHRSPTSVSSAGRCVRAPARTSSLA
jgi:DNA-binding winged helix-turn-helix (wHTH) protein